MHGLQGIYVFLKLGEAERVKCAYCGLLVHEQSDKPKTKTPTGPNRNVEPRKHPQHTKKAWEGGQIPAAKLQIKTNPSYHNPEQVVGREN